VVLITNPCSFYFQGTHAFVKFISIYPETAKSRVLSSSNIINEFLPKVRSSTIKLGAV